MSNQETSSLPVFRTKPSQDFPGWLLVTCPRDDCGSKPFIVHGATWRKPLRRKSNVGSKPVVTFTTRPCPYCFRVSKITKRG